MSFPLYTLDERKTIFDKIIDGIVCGKSVRSILIEKGMPSFSTLLKWMEDDEQMQKQYARAKEESADTDADNITSIAERVLDGEIEPNAARVAIDAYKWSAGKKKPKKYGDKLDLTTNGKDIAQQIDPFEAMRKNNGIND